MILLVAATERELCGHDGLVCGVGPVEAAASTARALAVREFHAVLHVGLAGARGIEPGGLVIGTEAHYCDLSADWPVDDRVLPDASLVELCRRALDRAAEAPIHTSAAVGGACNDQSQSVLVEAMEGFGVLRAAQLAGVPAVEIRSISNSFGEQRARWRIADGLSALERALPRLVASLADA